MTPAIVVYSRDGCHLCEDLIAELAAFLAPHGLGFDVRDVEADPETLRRYLLEIPVLTLDGAVVCQGRLDTVELGRLLAR